MNDNIQRARTTKGFLTDQELSEKIGKENTILDTSVLLSAAVQIGTGNVFYPGVVIEVVDDASISIGDNNTFYPGTYIYASASGKITIGDGNEFGTGGFTAKANMAETVLTIGDGGRYCNGASVMGTTVLGSGSQVLGTITVQSCTLASGASFQDPDPDKRAAVLKGFGLARGLRLEVGQVVNGSGDFSEVPVEWQRAYHPKQGVK